MHIQIGHILDAVIVTATTLASAAALALIDPAGAAATPDDIELRLLLLPLIGALIVSGGLIMLNPQPETRRIVIGRAMFALFFGVCGPQALCAMFSSLTPFARKPMPLLMLGGMIAGLAYVISKPFCAELYRRAQGVAKAQADRLEKFAGIIDAAPNPPAEPPPPTPPAI